MCELAGLGVLFDHFLESELLRFQERVFLIESGVVEELSGGYAQGVGYGLDDIGRRVLAALLDIAEVALGHARLIGKGLQGVVPV